MRKDLERRPELSRVAKNGVKAVVDRLGTVDRVISNSQHPNRAIVVGKEKDGKKVVVAVKQTTLTRTESQTYSPDEIPSGTRSMWVDED